MPNIQTNELELVKFPAQHGEFIYHYIANSDKNDMLVYTTYKDKNFFLQIVKREDDYLIKSDKLTRISPIIIIQQALDSFAKLHNLQLSFANIYKKKEKSLQHSLSMSILKKPNFFLHDFDYNREICIEIGFGSGRHLLHMAKEHQNTQFIGLEIHRPSIEQVIKQCKLQNINNILISDFDARIFLQLIKSNSIKKIFIHFPVPWDKKPHRRVISKKFIKDAIRVLQKDGKIELRTDSEKYFLYSFQEFQDFKKYKLEIRKNHELKISSKYEDRWKRMKKDIYDITFINKTISDDKVLTDNLTFDNKAIDFKKIKNKFINTTIKGDDFFIHFEKLYQIDENSGVIKLSLGSYEKPEHKYLIFKDNKIQYFPGILLPLEQNYKSHQKIKEFLYV